MTFREEDRLYNASFFAAIAAVLLLLAPFQGARAEWGWYAGDVCVPASPDSGRSLRERVREAAVSGLDWAVTFYPIQAGAFKGLSEVAAIYEAEDRRVIPFAGVGGIAGKGIWGEGIAFGVDPRSPVPSDSLQEAIDWADSHQGVFIFACVGGQLASTCDRWQGGTAFLGLRGDRWSPDCEVGGEWDRILRQGRRILIVGTQDPHPLRGGSRTFVWAKAEGAGEIVEGIRRGAVYVSERGGIRMDLRVNGATMGATVAAEDFVSVRFSASSRDPISRLALVGDGRVVWEAKPDSGLVEERLRLPVGAGTCSYLRPVVESRAGGYRALGNPIFLTAEDEEGEGEEAALEAGTPETLYASVNGALETSLALTSDSRLKLLSGILKEAKTRAVSAHVLGARPGLIADEVLEDLLDDPDPGVRLGAAYAAVTRGGDGLSESLLGLLLDRDAGVRSYSARMILQSHSPVPAENLFPFLADRDPRVRLSLAEAVDVRTEDSNVINRLVEMLDDPDSWVSAAVSAKLVELGTRSFRVLALLSQAIPSGHGQAADLVGRIGDRRIIPALEGIFLKAPAGDLRRRCFLALDRLGAPYPERKQIAVRGTPSPPVIDGVVSPGEWDGGTLLQGFGSDEDGTPGGDAFRSSAACDAQTIYFMLSRPAPGTDDPARPVAGRPVPAAMKQDRVELSFVPTGGAGEVRKFVVTSGGAQLELHNGNPGGAVGWKAAVGRTGKTWNVECAIPLSSLDLRSPGRGRSLPFNLSWVEGSGVSRVSWSVTFGAPDDPARFGELLLER